jgi:hypothetical protein
MKKIFALLFSVSLMLGLFTFEDQASASETARDDYTFGIIELKLLAYLGSQGLNNEIGSPEFNNYVMNQLDSDADQVLANRSDYNLICAYLAEYAYRLSVYESDENNFGVPFNMESVNSSTLGEIKNEIQAQESPVLESGSIGTMATGTINLANARAYAERYYSSYNRYYPAYSNDCTNFVSQILLNGGKNMVMSTSTAPLISDNYYWYIRSLPNYAWSRSASWTVVTDLYSHLVRTQSSYSSTSKTNIINNAKSGDVIQFKKAGADRYSHTMWIYEKQSSNLLLSGHTNDYLKRSFNAITSYSTYRIIKM